MVSISSWRLPRPTLESILGLCVVLTLSSGAIQVPLYAALGVPPVLGAPLMALAGVVGLAAAVRMLPRLPMIPGVFAPLGFWFAFMVWAVLSATWSTAPDLVTGKLGLLVVSSAFLVLGICVGFASDATDMLLKAIFAAGLVTAGAIFLFGNQDLSGFAGSDSRQALKTFEDTYQATTQCVSLAAMAALVCLLRGSQSRLGTALWGAAWFALTIASLVGGGRGAAVGGALAQISVVIFTMVLFWRSAGSGRLVWVLLAAPVVAVILVAAGTLLEFRSIERLLSIAHALTDKTGRTELWAAALRMADAHPLFGAGLASFEASANNIASSGLYPHNIFLEMLAETGLVGFSLFAAAFTSAIASLVRRARLLPFAHGALWLGLFVYMMFESNVSDSFTGRSISFVLGLSAGLAARFVLAPPSAPASVQMPARTIRA